MSLSVDLRHRFPGFSLDASFEVGGGLTAVMGRSGAGKTTIANAVAGLFRPDKGRVSVAGETLLDTAGAVDIPTHRRRIGYVFQEARLFPHLTVRRNLLYGKWFAGADGAEFDRIVEMLGIGPLLRRRPGTLSGGEKQRVALGRALLSNPRLLVMDEPLAALDAQRKAEIIPYLERLRDEAGKPILYVSHSTSEVARLATTVVMIDAGRVVACGPAAEVLADPSLARAMPIREAGAVLTATVAGHDAEDDLSTLAVSAGRLYLPSVNADIGARLRVRVEAHDILLFKDAPVGASALNVLPVTVTSIRQGDGPGAIIGLVAGDDPLIARITRRSVRNLGLTTGTKCFAVLKSTSVAAADVGGG